jgi:uncharacterized membrane protein
VIVLAEKAWLIPLLFLVLALAGALVWAGRRGAAGPGVRLGCGLLKLAGVLALALCLLEPLRVSQRARPGANLFALIADNSQSMQVKDAGQSQSRGEILRSQLTNDAAGWQSALAENFQLRRYAFDSQLQDARDFGELKFDGRASALESALRTAADRWRGQPVAGVLLFTDGNATDTTPDLSGLEGCPPVYSVVVGDDGLRDIALEKVTASQTAFEDAPVTVQAEVSARGFSGEEVITRIIEVSPGLSNLVAEQKQTTSADESRLLNFRFQIQPDKPGLHFYEVETRARSEAGGTAAQSREATLVNNRKVAVVDRGQEPFRVLYVGGRPNWDFKFLNRAMGDDPQVQLAALIRVAPRQPKFVFAGGELSNPLFGGFNDTNEETARYDQPVLMRLNTRDEFELRGGFPRTAAELFRYHAVIFGDVEADFFTHDQMVLMQRFVTERGGGFLMLGGAESFRQGNYSGTVIGSMLPVYLNQPGDAKLPSEWKLTLTREGWLQPWTRLRATEAEEQTRLDGTARLEVLNAVRGVKPGASVLATVSDSDNNIYPALAVQRLGLGRTAALMIGDMWRGSLRDETSQKDLAKSWRQLVRWLVSDVPSRVSVTPETAASGDPSRVRFVVTVRDEEFKPLDNATVQLTIRPVHLLQPIGVESGSNYVQLTADSLPNEPGKYEAVFVARDAGAYSVQAVAAQFDGTIVGRAMAGWASDPAAEEFRVLKPNRELLAAIAQRTGGAVLTMEDLRGFARRLPERRAPVTESWSDPLWHNPIVFLFVIGCFAADWGIRRWKGLP